MPHFALSSLVHVAEQPSPLTVLPSSHCSLPSTTPSPHTPAVGASTTTPASGELLLWSFELQPAKTKVRNAAE